jgi:hypothetical protein
MWANPFRWQKKGLKVHPNFKNKPTLSMFWMGLKMWFSGNFCGECRKILRLVVLPLPLQKINQLGLVTDSWVKLKIKKRIKTK